MSRGAASPPSRASPGSRSPHLLGHAPKSIEALGSAIGARSRSLGSCRPAPGGGTDVDGSGEWWQTFFDDGYVEAWAEQGAFDATAETAEQLIDFLALAPGSSILDIPCGFGRFAHPLHAAGMRVTAVDGSVDQVRRARREHPGPTYLVGDMRQPPAGPFDAVVNLFSSFGYFASRDDDVRCLEAWLSVLRPGGQLVMETMHRDRLAWLWDPEANDDAFETGWTDWTTGIRTAQVTIEGEEREFRVRLYSATELIHAFEDVGFTDVEAFGGLDGSPLDPSRRLVVRGRRPVVTR